MTQQELYSKLANDAHFAASFAVQNNFPAIKEKFADLGFSVNTPEQAYEQLINWSKAGGAGKLILYVTSVPYNNNADNATGGYGEFFKINSPAPKPAGGSNAKMSEGLQAGLLTFASSGLLGLIPMLFTGPGGGGTTLTPEQLAAMEAEEKKKAEEEAKKKKQMWMWIGGITGALALIGGFFFAFSGDKTKTSNSNG